MIIPSSLCPKHSQGNKSFPGRCSGTQSGPHLRLPRFSAPQQHKGLQCLLLCSMGIFHCDPGKSVTRSGWAASRERLWAGGLWCLMDIILPTWGEPEPAPNNPEPWGKRTWASPLLRHPLTALVVWKRKRGCSSRAKTYSSPRCLTAGETKSPMPLPGVQLTYGMSEMWGHTLRARGAEPRLHLAIPGGKCKRRCL